MTASKVIIKLIQTHFFVSLLSVIPSTNFSLLSFIPSFFAFAGSFRVSFYINSGYPSNDGKGSGCFMMIKWWPMG